jgi:hypothetical protein
MEKIINELKAVTNLLDLNRELSRIAALVDEIQRSRTAGEETALIINGKAVFTKLKIGMRFWISVEGTIQPIELIQKQENNILFFSELSLQTVTIHFF